MNSWNSETVYSLYGKQTMGYLTNFDNKTVLHPTRVAAEFRRLVLNEGADPNNPQTLQTARDQAQDFNINPRIPFETNSWGWFSMMLSELGKEKELDDLLSYADERLDPTWQNGGLFYPRNDELVDTKWNLTHIDPHSGNSGIGYARLNVKNGQRMMWEKPWTKKTIQARPWVDGIGFMDDVDFLRGIWDERNHAMIVTLKRWCGDEEKEQAMQIKNLPNGDWTIFVDGMPKESQTLTAGEDVVVTVAVGRKEVDIVVAQVGGRS